MLTPISKIISRYYNGYKNKINLTLLTNIDIGLSITKFKDTRY